MPVMATSSIVCSYWHVVAVEVAAGWVVAMLLVALTRTSCTKLRPSWRLPLAEWQPTLGPAVGAALLRGVDTPHGSCAAHLVAGS